MPEMEEPEMMYDDAMEYDSFSSGDSSSEKLRKKKNSRVVRSHFPETWLFQLKPVDEKGKAVVSLKVIIIIQVAIIVVILLLITSCLSLKAPDTLTSWTGEAVCMSKNVGIGLANPSRIVVKKVNITIS